MANEIRVGNTTPLSMTTDFGHSPIGRLADRTVRVGQGQRPRLKFGPIVKGVGLLSRFVNSVTPKGQRVESKLKAGLEDFSKRLGETMGALIPREDGKPDMKSLVRELTLLRHEAEPITKRGTDYQELLEARVGMSLGLLSRKGMENLLRSFNSQEVASLIDALARGEDPETHMIPDPGVDGDSALEQIGRRQDMARDLITIQALVLQKMHGMREAETQTFIRTARDFIDGPPNPMEDPESHMERLDSMNTALSALTEKSRALGLTPSVETRRLLSEADQRLQRDEALCRDQMTRFLEAHPDPLTDPDGFRQGLAEVTGFKNLVVQSFEKRGLALPGEFSQKSAELDRHLKDVRLQQDQAQCMGMVARFLENPPDSHADPNGFMRQLGEVMDMADKVRQSFEESRLELSVEFSQKLAELGQSLESLRSGNPDVQQLTVRNLGYLNRAVKDFGLDQLKEGIALRAKDFYQEPQKAYVEAFQPFFDALVGGNFTEMVGARTGVMIHEESFINLLGELDELEGDPQKTEDARKSLMFNSLANKSTEEVLSLARSLTSLPMAYFGNKYLVEGGSALLNHADDPYCVETGGSMNDLARYFENLREVVGVRLAEANVEMPPMTEFTALLSNEVEQDLADALRLGFGVRKYDSHYDLAGVQGTGFTPTGKSVENGIVNLLDTLARKNCHTSMILDGGFGLQTRLMAENPDEPDQNRLREILKNKVLDCLDDASDEQLRHMYANLTSGPSLTQRRAIPPMDESRHEYKKLLASTGRNLDVVEEALAEKMNERNILFQAPPLELREAEPTQVSLQNLSQCSDKIKTWLATPLHSQGEGQLEGAFRQTFEDIFFSPLPSSATNEAISLDKQPLGVCDSFYKDFNRSTYKIQEGDNRPRVLTKKNNERETFQDGVEALRNFCGGDRDLLFKISQYANQGTLAPFMFGLHLGAPDSPFVLSNGLRGIPAHVQGNVSYTLSKNEDGGIKIGVKSAWTLVNVTMTNRKGDDVLHPMNPNSSHTDCRFDVTLETDGRVTVGPVSYSFNADRGLDVYDI